jgi:hypothetical protein
VLPGSKENVSVNLNSSLASGSKWTPNILTTLLLTRSASAVARSNKDTREKLY